MNSTLLVNASAIVLFIFTLAFSYSYTFIKSTLKVYDYVKCLTGGFIIGIILVEVLPDIYSSDSMVPAVVTGISFFFLFTISKLYIERANVGEQDSIPAGASKKEALIFILALSLHSFMEGLGISNKENEKLVWYLVSILIHKWLEAIVLGASVLTSDLSPKVCFVLLLVYSSLTSVGALLGKQLSSGSSNSLIRHTLDGIAAGSFFYIGFVEMVGNEFETSSGKLTRARTFKKTLSMFIGYFIITTVICLSHTLEELYHK
ncbi:solute carrier family 39 (zinc transporter), member 1/2/3 [Nematocida homosporus]|uniref:solute carrier family 39 (zinc transporter), member 1/2/3 n=1 Tax=Nematocida homosporus TaxID=1912981 RepID=UPI00221FE830|nr:solute carrier family 39 (zinc transporter), member 1/2/3 [Nematocida homosporus]KAI5187111.1 solute carrier family 39 (zinc transporter), member 1/2/3 [Nematocida homosporus]